jgi:hypothetical protein
MSFIKANKKDYLSGSFSVISEQINHIGSLTFIILYCSKKKKTETVIKKRGTAKYG